ncbi:MAG: efflux RND transporter periplasmic adaptor subunit [Elusimicrobia bacterium]|nr:efflux RND transporter periplasmic adaptor subunit [Elusimicrobiota bacterium]
MVSTVKRWSKARWAVAVVAAAAVAAGGFYGYKRHKAGKSPAPDADNTAQVERGDIELHFKDSGELTPKRSIDIAPKVSGRVIELLVDEGSKVKQGDRLAVIQPGRTEAERYVPIAVASPIDGVVMRYQKKGSYQEESSLAKLGDYVIGLMESTNPNYLMSVADITKLVVKMKISEMDILKLKEGMPVTVEVDALPGSKFPSKVTMVSPQAEKDQNNLKNFKVEVSLLQSDPRLKPGMTARVDGLLDSRKNVLKVPLSAVFEEKGKEIAYLAPPNKKDKPATVPLKLGLRNETDVEVKEGVKEGQKLLTEKPAEQKKS